VLYEQLAFRDAADDLQEHLDRGQGDDRKQEFDISPELQAWLEEIQRWVGELARDAPKAKPKAKHCGRTGVTPPRRYGYWPRR